MDKDKLNDALLKKALGYKDTEEAEEFALIDGELKLTKRKTSTKVYPPDLSALQFLMEKSAGQCSSKYANMTLEELQREKLKLLKLLAKEEK